jgi:hypothetical protein
MKSSCPIPTPKDLLKAYNCLQSENDNLDYFLEIFQWARFDARLGEILVVSMKKGWTTWNPLDVGKRLVEYQWPEVFGVLGENVMLQLPRVERKKFGNWLKCCFNDVTLKKEWSIFSIGTFAFGGKLQRRQVDDTLVIYTRWGFYGDTPMVAGGYQTRTIFEPTQRHKRLQDLFKLKRRISVADYILFLDNKITKRTAELDLRRWATKNGNTRGATYSR